MMISVNDLFSIIMYMLGSILLIVLIVLAIRLIKTLNRIDYLIDDVSYKSSKLNGVFDIVDNTTDAIANVSDAAVGFLTKSVRNVVNRKKKEEDNNE